MKPSEVAKICLPLSFRAIQTLHMRQLVKIREARDRGRELCNSAPPCEAAPEARDAQLQYTDQNTQLQAPRNLGEGEGGQLEHLSSGIPWGPGARVLIADPVVTHRSSDLPCSRSLTVERDILSSLALEKGRGNQRPRPVVLGGKC